MTHFTSLTYVWFRTLTDEEIAYYVDTFQPFDKAGAYGIQELSLIHISSEAGLSRT